MHGQVRGRRVVWQSTAGASPGKEITVDLYGIIRRNGLASGEDLEEAAGRSSEEGDKAGSGVRWIRSYVLAASNPPSSRPGRRPTARTSG
jgi:hypothetical protein